MTPQLIHTLHLPLVQPNKPNESDLRSLPPLFHKLTPVPDFPKVQDALNQAGLKAELATVTMRPETETELEGDQAESMQKLLDALENLDDVQEVFTNASL